MAKLLSQSIADLRALRDSWGSVRGGWRGARQDAAQLLLHRRLLVDTTVMTQNGTQTVMRTQLRLSGDAQTDVLRAWLSTTSVEKVEETAQAHFRSLAMAAGGWAAALGLQRVFTRLAILAGSLVAALPTTWTLLHTAPEQWLHAALSHWGLLSGFPLVLLGVLVRWILRLRLRAIFRRGLSTAMS
jgi:hypothetical protein